MNRNRCSTSMSVFAFAMFAIDLSFGAQEPTDELAPIPEERSNGDENVTNVNIISLSDRTSVIDNTLRVFQRRIEDRCKSGVTILYRDGKAVKADRNAVIVELAIGADIGSKGFRIEDADKGAVRITGNDEKGLLYGIGKFLRSSRYDKGKFMPGSWRGVSVPVKPVRGIYLASHFYDFWAKTAVMMRASKVLSTE